MSERKKRIMLVGECSWLNTGFAVFQKAILDRLSSTGKYELAELGAYGLTDDPRAKALPWKFYGNLPNPNSPEENEFYNSSPLNVFGSWRFEEYLLDFRPDIVLDLRDWSMVEFEERSPFRKYFHWCLIPTCDSHPQNPAWLSTYMNADSVFTYSDYGLRILNESNSLIKTKGVVSPGMDLENFVPITNKKQHKIDWGLSPDSLIILTLMRNQIRKLFPDLIKSFRLFLDQAPSDIAGHSYLYLHTSYPDYFDIPTLIFEHGVSHRCLFTYKCTKCKYVFVSHYQDARGICKRCGKNEAFLPNTHVGLNRNEIAKVYNLADIYIQYSNCEGFGLSVPEAGACGVPAMVTNYSAMEDFVDKLKSEPINVQRMLLDGELGAYRALPDNIDLVNKLIKFFELPEIWKAKKSFEVRKATEKHYNWDSTVDKIEKYFDSLTLPDQSETWYSPSKQFVPTNEIPIDLPAEQFVEWAIINIAGREDLLNHYMCIRLIRDISWGSTTQSTGNIYFNEMSSMGGRPKRRDFSRENLLAEMKNICDYMNFWEFRRSEMINKKEI